MILLLDFGASRIKVAEYDGSVMGPVFSIPSPEPDYGDDGSVTIPPTAYHDALDKILFYFPRPDAICLCTEMGGHILVDWRGNFITPYISWRDKLERKISPSFIAKTIDLSQWISMSTKIAGIPIIASIGDMYAAILGAGLDDKSICVNIGTGSQVSRIIDRPSQARSESRAFFGRFIDTVTHLAAGEMLRRSSFWEGHAAIPAMINNYISAIKLIDPAGDCDLLCFAGGISRLLPEIAHQVAERTGRKYVIGAQEETLVGLSILAKQYQERAAS